MSTKDNLDGLSIKPSSDDAATFRRVQSKAKPEPARKASSSALLVFVIVLMAIFMGIGGYTLYEVQLRLRRATELLNQGEANIAQLDSRLNATGSDVSKTLLELSTRMAASEEEIRKLWDLSNKRNRKSIEEQQAQIQKITKQLTTVNQGLAALQKDAEALAAGLKEAVEGKDGIQKRLASDLASVSAQFNLLQEQLDKQTDVLQKTNRELASYRSRMKDTDDAIAAIDEHRRLLNQQVAELQAQVRGSSR